MTYIGKPVRKVALRCDIEPSHCGVDDGIQKLLKHLLRSSNSGGILCDKGRKEDQSTADPNGRKHPNVKRGVFISR